MLGECDFEVRKETGSKMTIQSVTEILEENSRFYTQNLFEIHVFSYKIIIIIYYKDISRKFGFKMEPSGFLQWTEL